MTGTPCDRAILVQAWVNCCNSFVADSLKTNIVGLNMYFGQDLTLEKQLLLPLNLGRVINFIPSIWIRIQIFGI